MSAGVRFHAAVGRIALVMAVAAASGGLTSTFISGMVQVCEYRVLLLDNVSVLIMGCLYMH